MDNYDTMTMGFQSAPVPLNGLQHLDYMSIHSGQDTQDQYSNMDSEFMRCVALWRI